MPTAKPLPCQLDGRGEKNSHPLRQALAEIRVLNESLEKKVTQRTSELEKALHLLNDSQDSLARSEARAAIGLLVASVSHDLATPLGNGVMAAGTLLEQTAGFRTLVEAGTLRRSELTQFVSKQSEGLTLVLANLNRANELLGNFKQVSADQDSERCRPFDLRQLMQDISQSLLPTLRRYPHQLILNVPEGIQMHSLPGPLGQVLINLINNAYIHAFSAATVGKLTLSARDVGDSVEIVVADDGQGMSLEVLENAFRPYFSTGVGEGGTGLGLPIVKRLVANTLHGHISVSSTPGQGTCFTLSLPKNLPSHEAEQTQAVATAPS